MELGFTQEQEMLRKTARHFLEKECPKSLVREMETDEKGYPPELWKKMEEMGWLCLILPEEYGGSAGNFMDLAILFEEMGRALLPGPYFSTVVLGALPILAAGSEEQKKDLLTKIAKGEYILTLAFTEPNVKNDATAVTVKAVPDQDDYLISGTKLFVPDADVADQILCVARTREGKNPQEGITVFVIDAKSPGITYTRLGTMAGDIQCEVAFDRVRAPKKDILGEPDQGWPLIEKTLEQAAVAQCALMVGGAQKVLEMSVEYAKTRIQFDCPIGTFQAVQHRCADQLTDVEGAKYLTYQAAWRISEGLPCAREAAMAKAWVSLAYRRVCTEAQQTHAGIGITWDYDLGLYTRRAKAAELAFGGPDFHLEATARHLGL